MHINIEYILSWNSQALKIWRLCRCRSLRPGGRRSCCCWRWWGCPQRSWQKGKGFWVVSHIPPLIVRESVSSLVHQNLCRSLRHQNVRTNSVEPWPIVSLHPSTVLLFNPCRLIRQLFRYLSACLLLKKTCQQSLILN